MKTLKKATAFALSLALGLSLTACSNGGTSSQSSTSGQDGSGSVDWPTKAINFVVPWSAGGDTDFFARTLNSVYTSDMV